MQIKRAYGLILKLKLKNSDIYQVAAAGHRAVGNKRPVPSPLRELFDLLV